MDESVGDINAMDVDESEEKKRGRGTYIDIAQSISPNELTETHKSQLLSGAI